MAIILIAIMVLAAPAFAQVDFSGEWSVKNHEDCLTNSCQPPLGDTLVRRSMRRAGREPRRQPNPFGAYPSISAGHILPRTSGEV